MHRKQEKRNLKKRQARAADIDQIPSQLREAYRNVQIDNRAKCSDQLQHSLKEEFNLISDNVSMVRSLERKEAKILKLLSDAHQSQEDVFDHVRKILYDENQGGDCDSDMIDASA